MITRKFCFSWDFYAQILSSRLKENLILYIRVHGQRRDDVFVRMRVRVTRTQIASVGLMKHGFNT